MAEDSSSGQQPTDDERRLERVEQWLDGLKETLCNLTQMMATLTVEVLHGRYERLPDQVGDRPENGHPGDGVGEMIGDRQNPGRADLEAWNPRGGPQADPHHRV